jgi:CBS domain-containing protein
MLVKDILKLKGDGLFSIAPDTPLPDAVARMVDNDVGSLVVLRGGSMVGLITFREVLAAIKRHGGDIHEVTVKEIMVRNPVVADPDDPMDQVRAVMTDQHVRYLPIVHDRKLLGILSFHDIARAALKLANFENKLLKQYIKNWPEESQS